VTALADETRALGDLAARGARGLTGLVEETHAAIAERSFRGALASSSPVRRGHDAIAALTYTAVGELSAGAIRVSARGLAATVRPDASLADGRPTSTSSTTPTCTTACSGGSTPDPRSAL
jgi:hypothetical protein